MQLVTLFGFCLKAVILREDKKKKNEWIKIILTIITTSIEYSDTMIITQLHLLTASL